MRNVLVKNCPGFIVLIALFFVTMTGTANAEASDAEKCLDCHDDIWQEGSSKPFVHLPFQQQKCQKCHTARPTDEENYAAGKQRRRVKWLGRNYTPGQTHWFNFPASKAKGALFIEAKVNRKKILRNELPLPPLSDLQRYDNDQTSPKISNVRVLEVQKGLFFSATISWDTDESANSMVNYGLKKLNMYSPLGSHFTKKHLVTLTSIKSQKTYQFTVISEDLFGNKTVSDPFTLSTAKTFSSLGDNNLQPGTNGKEIKIDTEIFQSDGRYLVKITANQPVPIALGTMVPSQKKPKYGNSGDGREVVKHVVTNNPFLLNISICYNCHQQYKEGLSHPVNVYPKRGMTIPPEYSTLPDGRITCMSCHAAHGSYLEDRLIKSSKKELCVGCHKDML